MFKVIKAEIYKYLFEMKNYYPDYIGNFILTFLFFFIFFSKLDFNNKTEILNLIVGFIFWFFSCNSISQMSISISEEKQLGTFEQLLLKPISIEIILMIRTFCWNFISLIIVFIIFVLSIFIFPISHQVNFNIFLLIYVYIITIISFIGISYFLAAATLIYTKTASFSSVIQYLFLFLSGSIIPLNLLPKWIYILSQLIPLPHSINISVSILTNKIVDIKTLFLFTLLSIFYFFLGLNIFKYSIKKASIEGVNSSF